MLPSSMLGMIDFISGEGAAAATDVYLRPTEHEVWVINTLTVWHDDPAGLTLYYMYWDTSNLTRFGIKSSLAANTYTYMYNDCQGLPEPIVCFYDHYVRLNMSGIAAGKKIYYSGMITRFRGLPTGYGL